MCNIYAGQDPERYALVTRSLRIDGFSTSIRLENAFWDVLEQIAFSEGRSLPDLLSKLHQEVTASTDAPVNFTSILRSSCLIFLENRDQGRRETAAA